MKKCNQLHNREPKKKNNKNAEIAKVVETNQDEKSKKITKKKLLFKYLLTSPNIFLDEPR